MLKSSGLILQLSEGTGLPISGRGVISVKNFIATSELWVDDDFEMMIAVEVT